MKYQRTLARLYNAPMTYGRLQLRSSAGLHLWQMQMMRECEARLFLQEVQRQVEQALMEHKFIISLENVPPILRQ